MTISNPSGVTPGQCHFRAGILCCTDRILAQSSCSKFGFLETAGHQGLQKIDRLASESFELTTRAVGVSSIRTTEDKGRQIKLVILVLRLVANDSNSRLMLDCRGWNDYWRTIEEVGGGNQPFRVEVRVQWPSVFFQRGRRCQVKVSIRM